MSLFKRQFSLSLSCPAHPLLWPTRSWPTSLLAHASLPRSHTTLGCLVHLHHAGRRVSCKTRVRKRHKAHGVVGGMEAGGQNKKPKIRAGGAAAEKGRAGGARQWAGHSAAGRERRPEGERGSAWVGSRPSRQNEIVLACIVSREHGGRVRSPAGAQGRQGALQARAGTDRGRQRWARALTAPQPCLGGPRRRLPRAACPTPWAPGW